MTTSPTFYPYSPEPHRGIAQSRRVARDVIKLTIDAEEARAWFFETHPCQRLRELIPSATAFLIEDYYLGKKQNASRRSGLNRLALAGECQEELIRKVEQAVAGVRSAVK
ncbi:hypothetical protein SAMD00023378_0350 [Ralstonia sp. NT80]|nr:hypothetical protein SAMD00023378_0350 [Ralstonia sp. NT80]